MGLESPSAPALGSQSLSGLEPSQSVPGALGAARAGSGCSPFVVDSFIHRVVIAQKPQVQIWSGAAAELCVPLSSDGTG